MWIRGNTQATFFSQFREHPEPFPDPLPELAVYTTASNFGYLSLQVILGGVVRVFYNQPFGAFDADFVTAWNTPGTVSYSCTGPSPADPARPYNCSLPESWRGDVQMGSRFTRTLWRSWVAPGETRYRDYLLHDVEILPSVRLGRANLCAGVREMPETRICLRIYQDGTLDPDTDLFRME